MPDLPSPADAAPHLRQLAESWRETHANDFRDIGLEVHFLTCAGVRARDRTGVRAGYSSSSNSSTERCACLRMCASVERLMGRCAGTISLSVSCAVCFCKRM